MLAPPYCSDTVMPSTPRSPNLRHRSMGNWSSRSISPARGAISACANSRTASRSASMSSPSWKFRPGRLERLISCLLWKFGERTPPGSVGQIAALHAHQRAAHGGNQFFAAFVDGIGAPLGHDDRAARLDHPAFHAKALALGGRSEDHTSELQSRLHLVCRLLLEKKKSILHWSVRRPLRGRT